MEYPFKDLLPLDEVLEREGYYKDWTHLDPEVFYSLTQISEYIKTKGYGVDVRLLIAQLAEHFGLKTAQVVDLANLLSTKHDALKDQFDVVIRDATSGADWGGEIVLARGGKPTLGARLDETTAQLAQTVNKVGDIKSTKDYGLKPNGTVNENTLALQMAFNDLKKGDTLIIQSGQYKVSNLVVPRLESVTLDFKGELIGTSTGTTIRIGSETEWSRYVVVLGLTVTRLTNDSINENIGVDLVNQYAGSFDIKRAIYHNKNVVTRGMNSNGFSYNKIYLGHLLDGKENLVLSSSLDGWCNQNSFYGGSFSFSNVLASYADRIHINIPFNAEHQTNANTFYSPSFESMNASAKAAIINGVENLLFHPRMEVAGSNWLNGIEFTDKSSNNQTFFGYGVRPETVKDEGLYNTLHSTNSFKLAGGSSQYSNIDINVSGSPSYKAISIKDSGGTERFYLKGSGEMFANQPPYFTTGFRYQSVDGTNQDRGFFAGSGTPEGKIAARVGSLYLNTSGSTGSTLYVKETGTGNTGWVAK